MFSPDCKVCLKGLVLPTKRLEGWNLQLIFQAFDLTNKTNFGSNFHNRNTSGSFMKPEGFMNPSSSFTPRAFVGEFGARFTF